MAEITTKRISELPAAESVGSTDLFVMEQNGAAKKVAASLFVGSGVVFMTYDESTFEDIETAYNDGKMVYVQDENYAYPLTFYDGDNAEFSGYTTEGHVIITCSNTDEWDKQTVSYMNAVTLAQSGQVLWYNGLNWSAHTPTKSDVGLANVDNTSDLAKPISTATQTALDGKITAPSGATSGQFLVYNGTAWVAQTVPNANGVSF